MNGENNTRPVSLLFGVISWIARARCAIFSVFYNGVVDLEFPRSTNIRGPQLQGFGLQAIGTNSKNKEN